MKINMLFIFTIILTTGFIFTGCEDPASNQTPMNAPTELGSISQTETTIYLWWNPMKGATKYHIYIGSTSGNLKRHSSPVTPPYTLTSLTPNTTYHIAISAEGKSGEGAKSSPITVTTYSMPPTGLVSITKTETTIALAWDSVNGATRYHVYAGTYSGNLTKRASPTSASYLLSSLSPNTTYLIEVSAETDAGESNRSTPINVTTSQSQSIKPASPSGLKADVISNNSVSISWNSVTGATGYKIFVGTTQTGITFRGESVSTNYQITDLNSNTEYYIAVSTVTAANESDLCAPINEITKPAAPTGLTASAITSISASVNWNFMSGVSGYIVYVGTSPETMDIKGTPTNTSFNITGLNPNTEYYIAVSAQNVSGGSVRTSPVRITTLHKAPTGLTVESIPSSTIRVSWNAESGAASYKLYRSTSPNTGFINIHSNASTTYNDTGLSLSTTYYYKVSAVNSNDIEGEQSPTVSTSIQTQTKAITSFRFESFSVNGTINGPNITVTVPNIVNLTALVPTITHNGKSISPASGAAQNFSSPIQYTVTAEDNTTQNYTVTVTVTDTTLAAALAWLNVNDRSGETYTIVVLANESMGPRTINLYSSVNVILNSGTTERTISLNSNGSLFTIRGGTLTLGNNITLQGRSSNNASLVLLNGGNLVMNTGSKIVNNAIIRSDEYIAQGGGVYSLSGTFTMNGGTISGNRVQINRSSGYSNSVGARGGGVHVVGRFIMNGGTITNNTAYSEYFECAGGGVYVDTDGSFTLTNGTISNNYAESKAVVTNPYAYGGGVAVWGNGILTMQGGTISGNNATTSAGLLTTTYAYGGGIYVRNDKFTKTGGTIHGAYETTTSLRNTAKDTSSGHAVYAVIGSTILKRNSTAGTSVNLDSSRTGSGWE